MKLFTFLLIFFPICLFSQHKVGVKTGMAAIKPFGTSYNSFLFVSNRFVYTPDFGATYTYQFYNKLSVHTDFLFNQRKIRDYMYYTSGLSGGFYHDEYLWGNLGLGVGLSYQMPVKKSYLAPFATVKSILRVYDNSVVGYEKFTPPNFALTVLAGFEIVRRVEFLEGFMRLHYQHDIIIAESSPGYTPHLFGPGGSVGVRLILENKRE